MVSGRVTVRVRVRFRVKVRVSVRLVSCVTPIWGCGSRT